MSEWFEIVNSEDVELSENGTSLEVLFNTNEHGNQYVDIPIEFITNILANDQTRP